MIPMVIEELKKIGFMGINNVKEVEEIMNRELISLKEQ